ncbi:uncharacterized protein LOC125240125 [Leguminivora glycinivorella]|uniref:uncharacterized protein LOC125240125 n=1 Tax=Leguminivora glycinivorella TaxID=1035111 RepID=UPI00200F06EF|nr:uncharacterized protein LOC125240125 [Leguminivora glycinivorella]
MKVCAGGAPIQHVTGARLLGFHLDSALTWEAHIDQLCKRLGSACFALRRLTMTAGKNAVRECYFATVHSLLTYGVELWGRASDWRRVFSQQKRAIRAMSGKAEDAPARDLFRELKILPLPCLFIYQVSIFTHEHQDMYKRRGINSNYNLRSNRLHNRLVAEQHKLAKSERSVYIIGPSIYNRLPNSVRDAVSTAAFKVRLKMWLTQESFYSYDDFFSLPIVDKL